MGDTRHGERSDSSSDDGSTSDASRDHKRAKHHHKDKKSSKKSSKKHKKSKKSSKDDKLLKEAKKFLKKKLAEGTAVDATPVPANVAQISADDYFAKNAEFSTWLLETKQRYFSDLSTEESHSLFDSDFVPAWNAGKLPGKLYAGLTGTTMRRSAHRWGIKSGGPVQGASVGMAAALEEDREQRFAARDEAQQAQRAEQRRWNKDQKEWLDEMLPKATGREAMVEKKLAAREANRAREESPDMPPGRMDLMGDGEDSFAAAKAREARRADWRDKSKLTKREEVQQKLAAAQQEENEKMAMFRSLVAQGPITIRKRE